MDSKHPNADTTDFTYESLVDMSNLKVVDNSPVEN
jgi:hypothetical protein